MSRIANYFKRYPLRIDEIIAYAVVILVFIVPGEGFFGREGFYQFLIIGLYALMCIGFRKYDLRQEKYQRTQQKR